ncbi:hypothetical protein JMUB7511_27310 [Staphylococcus aureus]
MRELIYMERIMEEIVVNNGVEDKVGIMERILRSACTQFEDF